MRTPPDSRLPAEGRPLRIAMIGQRGVPATYGGVEHHVAHLGRRLAGRGHQVTVFCRPGYVPERLETYDGMRLRHVPTLSTKHLDAIVHSLTCTVAALPWRPDIVHYHALGPGLCSALPRYLSSARVVQTVHGFDDRRAKWGRAAQGVLRTARRASERVPDAVVAVSREVEREYLSERRGLTVHIPNGVDAPSEVPAEEELAAFGLRPRRYVLFVGRLVPEKAPDLLIDAFRGIEGDVDLVIAGGTSFTAGYVGRLQEMARADRRIRLLGYVYGDALAALYAHAAAFVQPSSLEGMPLTLLEAMAHATPVIVSDIAPHLEVIGAAGPGGRVFASGDAAGLRDAIARVLADQPAERAGAAARRDDVLRRHSWDAAADALEDLYRGLLHRPAPAGERGRLPWTPAHPSTTPPSQPKPPTIPMPGGGRGGRTGLVRDR
ncbi:glycosyltransferase family 4 protein [Actinomadura roseirufa]|uniref:glycosyltransferase family 4 protein n=1 Tax=Actinomadura roseirufa TaxID=2094049 RepID=UPI00104178FB|nr:glycosyltransferase family 4 protein [Actinomadura roseirufa]